MVATAMEQYTVISQDQPVLDSIKPDTKTPLSIQELLPFEHSLCDYNEKNSNKLRFQYVYPESSKNSKEMDGGFGYIDHVLNQEECSSLKNAIDNCAKLSFWSASGRENTDARNFRDADTIEVSSTKIANCIWSRINNIHKFSPIVIPAGEISADGMIVRRWERELVGEWEATGLNHELLFAKYPSLGSFAPHTDGRATLDFNCRSFYSVIIFLNTIIDAGGGTKFYHKEVLNNLKQSGYSQSWTGDDNMMIAEIEPIEGRMLIFDQEYVHEGVPSLPPNQKYIIRSDIMFTRKIPLLTSPTDIEAYKLYCNAELLAENGNVDESISLFKKAFRMSKGLKDLLE